MHNSKHVVAVFGGAVAGAEAAFQLTQRDIQTVVFEQNALPYGKIEDGLPKWHVKLRNQEEKKINRKLMHPLVSYVPNTKLGRDINLKDISENWKFSAILLATGAWRDRPLPIENIDQYINKGLYYQNPFIYWFNHSHESKHAASQYETPDEAIVIGGGLASLDVAKVLMFETVGRALKEQGYQISLFELDISITKVLNKLNLTLNSLGIKGCSLYYRRRIQDMPLSPNTPKTPEQWKKAEKLHEKILSNYQRKYLFNVYPCHLPVDKIIENNRLVGIVFQQTKIENGKAIALPNTQKKVKAPLTIASIGSIPQRIENVPMNNQVYQIHTENCCKVEGFDNVFAIGNAVTGRGNIKESLKHSSEVTKKMMNTYLHEEETYRENFQKAQLQVRKSIDELSQKLHHINPPSFENEANLKQRIDFLQKKKNYQRDFIAWIKLHIPIRLEDMM